MHVFGERAAEDGLFAVGLERVFDLGYECVEAPERLLVVASLGHEILEVAVGELALVGDALVQALGVLVVALVGQRLHVVELALGTLHLLLQLADLVVEASIDRLAARAYHVETMARMAGRRAGRRLLRRLDVASRVLQTLATRVDLVVGLLELLAVLLDADDLLLVVAERLEHVGLDVARQAGHLGVHLGLQLVELAEDGAEHVAHARIDHVAAALVLVEELVALGELVRQVLVHRLAHVLEVGLEATHRDGDRLLEHIELRLGIDDQRLVQGVVRVITDVINICVYYSNA